MRLQLGDLREIWWTATMRYQLSPVQTSIGEGGFADFKVCNENGHAVVTLGFADEHEARIARALMIRAISNAVLIVSHTTVGRLNSDVAKDDPHSVGARQSSDRGAIRLLPSSSGSDPVRG